MVVGERLKRAFAVIPISDVFERISGKLSELLGETKNHGK
jgi:hypothetical protein